MACENTAEATKAGLAAGISAVELDISMSQDKVFIILKDEAFLINPRLSRIIFRAKNISKHTYSQEG